MYTGSSGLYGNVKRNAKFAAGISALPYYPDVPGAPQNTVIGGASLWVMSGKKPAEYKGVAAFFNYLSSPRWPPRATSARATCRHQGVLRAGPRSPASTKQNPGTDVR
jgi:sn-glycerol 3-phosphate transport system substrate-binding protein